MIVGATRSEVCCLPQNINLHSRSYMFIPYLTSMDQLRMMHKLTMKMKREIVLGPSSMDDPTPCAIIYFGKILFFL
jgi:hypothetical protein